MAGALLSVAVRQRFHLLPSRLLSSYIEVFEPGQRHSLIVGDNEPQFLVTELTALQREIITLLGLSPADYGR
jgi:hypothetical protein